MRLLLQVVSLHILVICTTGNIFDYYDSNDSGSNGYSCECSHLNRRRIVNGRETAANEFPLMAGLVRLDTKGTFCGAVIISRMHALTAAHCIKPFRITNVGLKTGEHAILKGRNISLDDVIPLAQVIIHEGFVDDTKQNDIALLVTERPMEFSRVVGPACLPDRRIRLVHETVKILGWGKTASGNQSTTLRQVDLNVVPVEMCKTFYKKEYSPSADSQICTYARGRDSCKGDSGGPLLWQNPETNKYELIGLVSYGKGCASDVPGVNTDVSAFIPWIKKKTNETFPQFPLCTRL